jgi:hypothetical protein
MRRQTYKNKGRNVNCLLLFQIYYGKLRLSFDARTKIASNSEQKALSRNNFNCYYIKVGQLYFEFKFHRKICMVYLFQ